MSSSPRLPLRRRFLSMLLGLVMAGMLLGPSPAASSGPAVGAPKVRLPSFAEVQLDREERLASMWNARGALRATLGGRDFLTINSEVSPGFMLTMSEEQGIVQIETGTEMLTEDETSIQLVITRGEQGWVLSRGKVRLNGHDYFLQQGEVTVIELDARRGIFRANFSFLGRSEGRRPSELRVTNGNLSLRR